jgi:ribokinase
MNLLIVGTLAFDSIKTPFGEKPEILGGSAVHASMSASFYSEVVILGPIGYDFPKSHLNFLQGRKINTQYLQRLDGKTFRWAGYYEYDMNHAHTLDTKLNVLTAFDPELAPELRQTPFVFLANIDPELQLKVIAQLTAPKLICADTMNFWIENKRHALMEVIKKVDIMFLNDAEIREFMETPNLPLAARRMLKLGPKAVIVKKGEHGALLFTDSTHFAAPAYPQDQLRDPTGAGDSFAGGFMGYLAKTADLSVQNIRRAVIIGSVMASYNVEDFGLDRLRTLKHKEIHERFEEFRRFSEFEMVSLVEVR